jgi:hypothetical protein
MAQAIVRLVLSNALRFYLNRGDGGHIRISL